MMSLVALLLVCVPLGGILFTLSVARPAWMRRLRSRLAVLRNSLWGRLGLVLGTSLLLCVPLNMVDAIRMERSWRLEEVRDELRQQWGGEQTVRGPFLVVPVMDAYTETVETTDKETGKIMLQDLPRRRIRRFVFLPRELDIQSELSPQSLSRGLYDVLVYDGAVTLEASYAPPELPTEVGHTLEPQWDQAVFAVQLEDLGALARVDELSLDGETFDVQSGAVEGLPENNYLFVASPPIADGLQARVRLQLRGMDALRVSPLGDTNEVTLEGQWHSPSFMGFTLPRERTVDSERFAGHWTVPGVARPFPQRTELSDQPPWIGSNEHTVGVRLLQPVSTYTATARALTYGILIISLCLLTFLFIEMTLGLAMHPVQWLVNGLAVVVFYLVVLAGSEHFPFAQAYAAGAGITTVMCTVYTYGATRRPQAGGIIAVAQAGLFGAMFGMLQSEDHALLMGTGLVLLALVGLMWFTRDMDGSLEAWGEPEPAPDTKLTKDELVNAGLVKTQEVDMGIVPETQENEVYQDRAASLEPRNGGSANEAT